jgi:hypothetical protein
MGNPTAVGYVDEIVRGYTSSVEPIITSRESILCRLIDFEAVFTKILKCIWSIGTYLRPVHSAFLLHLGNNN